MNKILATKFIDKSGRTFFMEFVKTGKVQFDDRSGWMFMRDFDKPKHNQDVRWIHPHDVHIVWIREIKV